MRIYFSLNLLEVQHDMIINFFLWLSVIYKLFIFQTDEEIESALARAKKSGKKSGKKGSARRRTDDEDSGVFIKRNMVNPKKGNKYRIVWASDDLREIKTEHFRASQEVVIVVKNLNL